jgi:hypothetical protein
MQFFHFMSLTPPVGDLWSGPLEWAGGLFQRQKFAQTTARERVGSAFPATLAHLAHAAGAWPASSVAAAFDLARAQYAAAVQYGLLKRSLLASGALERRLDLLERLTLGPWARTV